jgi:RNA polymerase sigma-70 factor (ECF subfamily)
MKTLSITSSVAVSSETDARFIRAEGDRALLLAARDGDARACRELLERYGPRLLHVVSATHPGYSFAEDVVQEAFIRALEQADQLRQESSLFPWLVRIAIHVGYDLRRKVRRETLTDVFADVPEAKEAGPEAKTLASEDSLYVRKALEKLKPYQRELMVLRYFASFSVAELAEVFKKSEPAIRKDLQRARERVKKLLGDWFEL